METVIRTSNKNIFMGTGIERPKNNVIFLRVVILTSYMKIVLLGIGNKQANKNNFFGLGIHYTRTSNKKMVCFDKHLVRRWLGCLLQAYPAIDPTTIRVRCPRLRKAERVPGAVNLRLRPSRDAQRRSCS